MATVWNVKSKSADGSLDHILCDKPRQVFEALEPDPKASGADDGAVIHNLRGGSEALIRDVDASA
jgi:hypothetical protein